MKCPRCTGTGVCISCQGTGKRQCPYCQGDPSGCSNCDYSGSLACEKECLSCLGTGTITKEIQTEQEEKYRPKTRTINQLNWVYILLALLGAGFFLGISNPESLGFYPYRVLTLHPQTLEFGQYWSFFTSSFISQDGIHQLFLAWIVFDTVPAITASLNSNIKAMITVFNSIVVVNILEYILVANFQAFAYVPVGTGTTWATALILWFLVRQNLNKPVFPPRYLTWYSIVLGLWILLRFINYINYPGANLVAVLSFVIAGLLWALLSNLRQ